MSERNRRLLAFWAILALGLGVRLWRFGAVPEGINQDEAFAGTSSWGAGLVLGAGPPSAGGRGSWGRKRCWMGGTCRPEGCVWWAGFVPMGGA